MASYSPFSGYVDVSKVIFSAKKEIEEARTTDNLTKEENMVNSLSPPSNFQLRQRHRFTSVSSADTETTEGAESCVNSESSFRTMANIPEVGRSLLPQKLSQPTETLGNGTDNFSSLPETDSENGSSHEIMSSARFQNMNSIDMGGMMERFVMDVVEKKMRDRYARPTICVFCQRNGETVEYYSTHVLKDNRGKVICPVLRKYVCPKCKATGDNAHTLRHCPESRSQASIVETFKTPRTSSGFRKF